MTDQHEREWPSFGDILDELNSLGDLENTSAPDTDQMLPPTSDPAVAGEATPELQAEPNWAPPGSPDDEGLGTSFDAIEAESPEADDAVEAVESVDSTIFPSAPDAIDWSSWEFDAAAITPSDALSPDFATGLPTVEDESIGSAEIFEFDLGALQPQVDGTQIADDADLADAVGTDSPIDSVATANAIETDLQELFGMVEVDESESDDDLDSLSEDPADASDLAALIEDLESGESDELANDAPSESEAVETDDPSTESDGEPEASDDPSVDNVVPLHRSGDDLSHHLVGLDDAFDPDKPQSIDSSAAAEFVSIEEDAPKSDDSWDYLRPGEDEASKPGVFSRRRKFFGGDERKSRKAERKKTEDKTENVGPPCPKCEAPGRIDLNDPIGGKIHCSCRECDHVWSQFAEPTQESA